jgi:nanoRNase/pAp phosphatase (c-di-AMP/oligoRNAs hydrolase)
MDDAKQQLIDKLQNANNILVTVSRDPSVDQLASCIGLTLLLNKQGKHAAAVFSGKVPSTLEFLKPETTIEKNTDSLRDFIISLDKGKADKLRYKVEEDVVRIFITPYKTSLSEDDLEFSEGDFNVDVVVALGVQQQEDLDKAITAHGRILHDATVASVTTTAESGLGTINWRDPQASSLSELVTDLAQILGDNLLDEQIATALMTGIVSETGRFSNEKTTPQTMSASAALMAAGANQQLVATELESENPAASGNGEEKKPDGGMLEIDHAHEPQEAPTEPLANSAAPPEPFPPAGPQAPPVEDTGPATGLTSGAKLVTEPPKLGGTLTASGSDEKLDPVTDPLSLPASEAPALLDHEPPAAAPPEPIPPATEPPAAAEPPADSKAHDNDTLTDIEKSVDSPHASQTSLDSMRDEVSEALNGTEAPDPIEALNAQPMGGELHGPQSTPPPAAPAPPPSDEKKDDGPDAPPPVPPPIPFQFGNSPPPQ